MTPVHVAAAWGRWNILELLLANGGNPSSLDDDNCSPLHYAHQGDHQEAVSVLKKYCTYEKNDNDDELKYKLELGKMYGLKDLISFKIIPFNNCILNLYSKINVPMKM